MLALATAASTVLATALPQDRAARRVWTAAGAEIEMRAPVGTPDLVAIQTHLFDDAAPPTRTGEGSFEFFSAPGEGRECVEIARRILREARRGVGVRRDGGPGARPGTLPRPPRACARAGGRPGVLRARHAASSSGRTRLSRAAGLRRRGAVGEPLCRVPVARPAAVGRRPAASVGAAWRRAVRGAGAASTAVAAVDDPIAARVEPATDAQPAIAGTLRAPRRWERMLVEAAVIGGDPERWRRRLRALAEELRVRREEANRADPDSLADGGARPRRGAARAPRGVCAAAGRRDGRLARARPVGRLARALRGARAARAARAGPRAARARATCGRWRRWDRWRSTRCARVLPERLRLVEAEPPARRYGRGLRRHARPGARPHRSASSSCRASPSGCFRRSRGRIRCCPTCRAAG